jgi:chorismate mutase/prephenate dehydratase
MKNKTSFSNARIDSIRDEIDRIDKNILELINTRLVLAAKIGKLKEEDGADVLHLKRENRILEQLCELNPGPLKKKILCHIFTDIISASREIQRLRKITFLGPEATFTHMAAIDLFGRSAEFIPRPTIKDVFLEVEKGKSDYGVVPVENSIEGSVNYTLDLFFESNLKVCAEKYSTISLDLLSKTGNIKDVKVVYSHPQPVGQCRRWLRENLGDINIEECSSTSNAAQKAAEKNDSAAIASSEAARLYNLKVIEKRIEDHSRNTTRFLVIGNDYVKPTGDDKTSIMLSAPHIPGALHKVLEPVAKAGINMLKLESRPAKHENWSYFFFVDLAGHQEDQKVRETIDKMKEICLFLKILGSYPRATS